MQELWKTFQALIYVPTKYWRSYLCVQEDNHYTHRQSGTSRLYWESTRLWLRYRNRPTQHLTRAGKPLERMQKMLHNLQDHKYTQSPQQWMLRSDRQRNSWTQHRGDWGHYNRWHIACLCRPNKWSRHPCRTIWGYSLQSGEFIKQQQRLIGGPLYTKQQRI